MNELYSTVERHLRKQGSDAETQQLWQQLFEAFQDGEDGVGIASKYSWNVRRRNSHGY